MVFVEGSRHGPESLRWMAGSWIQFKTMPVREELAAPLAGANQMAHDIVIAPRLWRLPLVGGLVSSMIAALLTEVQVLETLFISPANLFEGTSQ